MDILDSDPAFKSGLRATIKFVDAAGKPAKVDGVPAWSTDRNDILTVTPDADGLGANIDFVQDAAAPVGVTAISAVGDADLGSGVTSVTLAGSINVLAGDAVSGVMEFAPR